jgi:hypothetical protein
VRRILFAIAMLWSVSAWAVSLAPPIPVNGTCRLSQGYSGNPVSVNPYTGPDVAGCENTVIAIYNAVLNDSFYNGTPCYEVGTVESFIDGTRWEPITEYINGKYQTTWYEGVWVYAFGVEEAAATNNHQPPCTTPLGEDSLHPTLLISDAPIYGAPAMQCPQNAHQNTAFSDFVCNCNSGLLWNGLWVWNEGQCTAPTATENLASVTIDPPCIWARNGSSNVYDHQPILTTGVAGASITIGVSTNQFIPQYDSIVYDGTGKKATFAPGWTQFRRVQNPSGMWSMWAVFQVPSDNTELQLFLHGDSCNTGLREVSYSLGACQPGTPGC